MQRLARARSHATDSRIRVWWRLNRLFAGIIIGGGGIAARLSVFIFFFFFFRPERAPNPGDGNDGLGGSDQGVQAAR